MKNKTQYTKTYGITAKAVLRGKCEEVNTYLHTLKKRRNILNKLTLHLNALEKRNNKTQN